MAVKPEEILARGQGPVQTTWADEATQPTAPVKTVQPQLPVATDEPTGVESVSYDTTTAQGEPNNPKNARERSEERRVGKECRL